MAGLALRRTGINGTDAGLRVEKQDDLNIIRIGGETCQIPGAVLTGG